MEKVDKKLWIMANLTKIKQKLTKFDEYCKENNYKLATKEILLIYLKLEDDEYESLKNTKWNSI